MHYCHSIALAIAISLLASTSPAAPQDSHRLQREELLETIDFHTLVVEYNDVPSQGRLQTLESESVLQVLEVEPLGSPGWSMVTHESRTNSVSELDSLIERVGQSPGIAFVSPVFGDADGEWIAIMPEIVIRFKDTYAEDALDLIKELAPNVEVIDENFGSMSGAFVLRPGMSNGFDVLALADDLANDYRVKWAEPDMKCSVSPDAPDQERSAFGGFEGGATEAVRQNNSLQFIPNDPLFGYQWAHLNTGQYGGVPGYDSDADLAWDITTGSRDIKILVLDDGVQLDHPDLNVLPGADFTNDPGGDSGAPVNQCDNHGTAVTGMITAIINNGIGVVGVAPDCKVLPARTIITSIQDPCTRYGTYNTSWIINALAWGLAQGARVSNHSYGSMSSTFSSGALEDQFNRTYDSGMVHFASSGNQGAAVIFPARFSSVNAVSSLAPTGVLAGSSNYGPEISICAPGDWVATTDRSGADGYSPNSDYVLQGGTSFSAPYAAGVAALILSVDPLLTTAQVEAILRCSARDLGDPGFDEYYGYGLVNAHRAVRTISADMNCDAVLDLADVVLLGNVLDGLIDLAGTCGEGQGDVDMDGDVDEDDYDFMFDLVSGVGP